MISGTHIKLTSMLKLGHSTTEWLRFYYCVAIRLEMAQWNEGVFVY